LRRPSAGASVMRRLHVGQPQTGAHQEMRDSEREPFFGDIAHVLTDIFVN